MGCKWGGVGYLQRTEVWDSSQEPRTYFDKCGFETGWDLGLFAAVLAPGQMFPPRAIEYKETRRDEGLPWWLNSKESTCNAGDEGDLGSAAGSGRSPERGQWQLTPVFLPGKSYGRVVVHRIEKSQT